MAAKIFEVVTRVKRDGEPVIVDSRLVKAETATKAKSFVSKLFEIEAGVPTQEEMLAHGKAGHPVYDANKEESEPEPAASPTPAPDGQGDASGKTGEVF